MFRYTAPCLLLSVFGLCVCGDESEKTAAALKTARQLADATIGGDGAKVIDNTYAGIVKELGGRQKAIEATEAALRQLKAQGITFTAIDLGQPGELLKEGEHTFLVVPTSMEATTPKRKVIAKSYLLGISPDAGRTWKFADGNGLADEDFRAKVLPKLPANLKLPEKQQPKLKADK